MVDKINSSRDSGYIDHGQSAATKSSNRIKYNAQTKAFEPIKGTDAKKIAHMTQTEDSVKKIVIPPDLTSPTFLKGVSTKMTSSCKPLSTNTKNVGKFFEGNASLYKSLISSVKNQ